MPRNDQTSPANDENVTPIDGHEDRDEIDGDALGTCLEKMESATEEIDAIMAAAKKKCEPHRKAISDIKKEAAEHAGGNKVVSALWRERRLRQRADKVHETLDDGQKRDFQDCRDAMGYETLPLFEQAVEQKEAS